MKSVSKIRTIICSVMIFSNNIHMYKGPSWSWTYGSWIYNYLRNQCLSPLKLWIRIQLKRDVLDTTLCDIVCQWLATGRWFSPGTPVSSRNKTDHHDITEILLKVALSTMNQPINQSIIVLTSFRFRICLTDFVLLMFNANKMKL